MNTSLLVAAVLFAVVTGANDGASLIATNLANKAIRPIGALAILAICVAAGPFVLGTAVATTFAHGLVSFGAAGGEEALLIAVGCAIGVVLVCSRAHLPTSVTQAMLGAIIGVGIGRGLPVAWDSVARALAILAAAPFVAASLAHLVAHLLAALAPRGGPRTHLRRLQAGSFLAQCLAYATNDAQKMIAVMAIATGSAGLAVTTSPLAQILIAIAFVAGTLLGIRGLGSRLGRSLFKVRPLNTATAGYAASIAVLGSAILGSPVSMAQSTAAGLVGSEIVLESYRLVRWEQALRIAATWLTTLPSAALCAALVGALTR